MELTIAHIDNSSEQMQDSLLAILDRAKKNDRRAQEIIYKRFQGKLLGVCLRYFSNRDDALEALNHSFLKIFTNLKAFDSSKSFAGWAYRIVQNTAIDYARKKIKSFDFLDANAMENEVGVEANVDQDLDAQDLLDLLHQLPNSTRIVFNLFAIEGYKHTEISKMLSISKGTSKWHVNSARKLLQTKIKNRR